MIFTTLNRIREHSPCADGWRKLLKYLGKTETDDEPLAYGTILEGIGLDDALWYLRAEPQHANIWRMFAVRCARRVQHLMKDRRSLQALDVAERHARGLATDAELATARAAAWAAVSDAAWAAAWAAVWDADRAAACVAARDAARATIRAAAWAAARAIVGADAGAAARAAWAATRAAARATIGATVGATVGAAAWAAVGAAAWDATWDTARDEQTADFEALLAAHHAMPGESCALVDWWQGESND